MENEIKVPTIGEPMWEGELTQWKLEEIVGGLLVPNQAMAKRLAHELLKNWPKGGR